MSEAEFKSQMHEIQEDLEFLDGMARDYEDMRAKNERETEGKTGVFLRVREAFTELCDYRIRGFLERMTKRRLERDQLDEAFRNACFRQEGSLL